MALIEGKEILLSVNLGTDASPDWNIIGCSTADGFSLTVDSIAVSNKCSGGFTNGIPGDASWSFSNTTSYPKTPDTGYTSYDDIFDLATTNRYDADGELRQFKLENIVGADFTYYRMGRGFITDLGDQMDSGAVYTTDITITGVKEVTNVQST